MKKKAWHNLLPLSTPDRPISRPRQEGITMVLDRCQGLEATDDLLMLAGDYIDMIKLSFGTSSFLDEDVLRQKIEIVKGYQIDIYPGGTLMEATLFQGVYPQFLAQAKDLGFTAIEISDGTITMTRQERNDAIQRALETGLRVITEVGKKNPSIELSATELCDQLAADLYAGAEKVIIEARESGRGVGIYDKDGLVREDKLEAIFECLDEYNNEIIWEAPRAYQQTMLILRCGPNVNLGNVKPQDILGLEALRCGLRYDTFDHFMPKTEIIRSHDREIGSSGGR